MSFDTGDGFFTATPPSPTFTLGDVIGILPRMNEMSNPGYRFTGWFENIEDENTRWRDNDKVSSNVWLIARWTVIPNPNNFRIGDADGDGHVTSADATNIATYVAGHNIINFCPLAADLDGDGEVTINDVVLLARWLIGHSPYLMPTRTRRL